jgi:hypothetical protein
VYGYQIHIYEMLSLMSLNTKRRLLFGYVALVYAAALLLLCGLIPEWGRWYSNGPYHRKQADALLHGNLALSHNPGDLALDLCWSEKGVHQVWGLGVALWQLPFDAAARLFGQRLFPDRLALGLFMALASYIVLWTWFGPNQQPQGQHSNSNQSWFGRAFGAVVLSLVFAPVINLLRTKMDHYYEVLAYVSFFGIILVARLVVLARDPTWKQFLALSALCGIGGLIRPTLVFYGVATVFISGFVVIHSARVRRCSNPSEYRFSKVTLQFLFGIALFGLGGAALFVTNYARFGNGWEFGHRLNASTTLTSIYSTRFDYPFKHVALTKSARELFGALFQMVRFSGSEYYGQGIVEGQVPVIRARKFNYTTYDLSYAVGVGLAWLIGIGIVWKDLQSRRHSLIRSHVDKNIVPVAAVLIAWSILASLPLIGFYMKTHAIGDRYMVDFAPAFSAGLIGLWLLIVDHIAVWARYSRFALAVLCLSLILWQGLEIAFAKRNWQSPLSTTLENTQQRTPIRFQPNKPFPKEYRTREDVNALRIPYNGEGWGDTGLTSSCCIFYVNSPRFVELELALVPGRSHQEAPVDEMRAKVGLEFLNRTSITVSNGIWIVHFSGPTEKRYQDGIQPLFLAFIPSRDLGKFLSTPTPWILKRISWAEYPHASGPE